MGTMVRMGDPGHLFSSLALVSHVKKTGFSEEA